MKKQSQVKKLYAALKSGRHLSTDDVYRVCKSHNAHKRISELEEQYGVIVRRIPFKRDGVTMRRFAL